MKEFNCPNCGSLCRSILDASKVVTCPSCGTTLFLNGDHITLAGEQRVMHDARLLFGIGDTIEMGQKRSRSLGMRAILMVAGSGMNSAVCLRKARSCGIPSMRVMLLSRPTSLADRRQNSDHLSKPERRWSSIAQPPRLPKLSRSRATDCCPANFGAKGRCGFRGAGSTRLTKRYNRYDAHHARAYFDQYTSCGAGLDVFDAGRVMVKI